MDSIQPGLQKTRIGFHYFPDALHYRDVDLHAWLPELQAMAASWLTLQAPLNRAIPESFICQLLQNEIQPILHFQFSPAQPPSLEDFNLLCRSYARWGARYAVLFDRPNLRVNWPAAAWAQSNLVERFLDIFQPLALAAVQAGLTPVFPPLEPGGDYWDTAFLRTAFEGLLRRNQTQLLERMALSCYAWSNDHPLNWGSGGPERWPGAYPYDTPRGTEDQRGFRIFDWYLALSEAVFAERRPILALAAGALPDETAFDMPSAESPHTAQNLLISRLVMGEKIALDPIPAELLACNFWLLTAAGDHPAASAAWYQPDGTALPVVSVLQQWATAHHWSTAPITKHTPTLIAKTSTNRPIAHYLLLASSDLSISDWQFNVIRYFADKYHPTIGFSPAEAVHANRVTVLGDQEKLPDSILDGLVTAGCVVDDLRGDGTTIATKLKGL
jgi:hypothetical protein